MKPRILFVALIGLALLSVTLPGDTETGKPILEKGDVLRFIKTFPELKTDFDKLGAEYDARQGQVTYTEAMMASSEFNGILKKHGWDENFWTKVSTIISGYGILAYNLAVGNVDPQLAAALKQIEDNAALSDAMKKQLKEQIMASKGALKEQGKAMLKMVHPKDMALIKPNLDALKKVLEK